MIPHFVTRNPAGTIFHREVDFEAFERVPPGRLANNG